MKCYVSTHPFGAVDSIARDLLEGNFDEVRYNQFGRKITSAELSEELEDIDVLVAGTEKISSEVLAKAERLKLICRVGIGLDSVPLQELKSRGVQCTYTPDAPAPAVAELTLGLMLNLLRGVTIADRSVKQGKWERIFGKRLAECTIGVIGTGRIGGRVIRRLSAFGSPTVLANSKEIDDTVCRDLKIQWVSKNEIYRRSDLISIHVPLTEETKNMIGKDQLSMFKPNAYLINTSRGGIVNEVDLADALTANVLQGAAIDVFETEPYVGALAECPNAILTCHMGSMTEDCRNRMEVEAVQDAVNFVQNLPLKRPVPKQEYDLQAKLR